MPTVLSIGSIRLVRERLLDVTANPANSMVATQVKAADMCDSLVAVGTHTRILVATAAATAAS